MSVGQGISGIAGEAGSSVAVGGTLVINGHANFIAVEGPSQRAGKTDLIVPIPGSASDIRGCGIG